MLLFTKLLFIPNKKFMIKKIIIGLFIFGTFTNNWFAIDITWYDPYWNNSQENSNTNENFVESQEVKDARQADIDNTASENAALKNLENNGTPYDTQENIEKRAAEEACKDEWNCLNTADFTIWVDKTIWVWFKVGDNNTSQVINNTLGTIMQKLMIALW